MQKIKNLFLGLFSIILLLTLVTLFYICIKSTGNPERILDERGNKLSNSISEIIKIPVNGIDQHLIIRGQNVNKPILLLLHGGPGSPEFPFFKDKDLNLEEGYRAAERCGLSIIAHVKNACGGDLDKIKTCIKLTGYVNSTDDFKDQPKIINGASDIIARIFEKKGEHTRAAVSVNSLPIGVAV